MWCSDADQSVGPTPIWVIYAHRSGTFRPATSALPISPPHQALWVSNEPFATNHICPTNTRTKTHAADEKSAPYIRPVEETMCAPERKRASERLIEFFFGYFYFPPSLFTLGSLYLLHGNPWLHTTYITQSSGPQLIIRPE